MFYEIQRVILGEMSLDAIVGRTGGARQTCNDQVSLLPSKQLTSKQRRMNVDAT